MASTQVGGKKKKAKVDKGHSTPAAEDLEGNHRNVVEWKKISFSNLKTPVDMALKAFPDSEHSKLLE